MAFGGGGVNPIPTAARFVLGIGELADQVGERYDAPGATVLEVTGVQAGRPGEAATLAVVTLVAGEVPGIGAEALHLLISRLADQIAVEAGTAAKVGEVGRAG
ncbi:hypothetical protein D1871_16395 [Nakamurella silvestris]|nr:hypothetical protein D1871_16395 [Nakamurella silvestris]